jgi:DNA-directed RNA polymerase specialized sigma24 family protein
MSQDDVSMKAAMRRAVAALPERERSVFQLCAVEGLGYPTIAGRLGTSVAEVERRLATALLAIDRHLTDAGYTPDPVGFGGKPVRTRLHRLARWLGSG